MRETHGICCGAGIQQLTPVPNFLGESHTHFAMTRCLDPLMQVHALLWGRRVRSFLMRPNWPSQTFGIHKEDFSDKSKCRSVSRMGNTEPGSGYHKPYRCLFKEEARLGAGD